MTSMVWQFWFLIKTLSWVRVSTNRAWDKDTCKSDILGKYSKEKGCEYQHRAGGKLNKDGIPVRHQFQHNPRGNSGAQSAPQSWSHLVAKGFCALPSVSFKVTTQWHGCMPTENGNQND